MDNRKVVVEDLIYIDDLEVLIYTTVAPISSTVFISSCKQSQNSQSSSQEQVINLDSIGADSEETQAQNSGLSNNYY